MGFGEEDQAGRVPYVFITLHRGYIPSAWLLTDGFDLDHLAEVMCVRFLQMTLFPHFLISAFWKEVTICSSHLRNREWWPVSLQAKYQHKSLASFLHHGIYLLSPIYVFIQSFICISSESWVWGQFIFKVEFLSPGGKQEKLPNISINKVPSVFSQAHLGNVLNPLCGKGLGIGREGLLH